MTHAWRLWMLLAAPTAAILSLTLLLPLTGEFIGCMALTLLAALIIML